MSSEDAALKPWRIAEQYFRYADFEIETRPHGDAFVAIIRCGFRTRRVYFDTAGRVMHVKSPFDTKVVPGDQLPLEPPVSGKTT